MERETERVLVEALGAAVQIAGLVLPSGGAAVLRKFERLQAAVEGSGLAMGSVDLQRRLEQLDGLLSRHRPAPPAAGPDAATPELRRRRCPGAVARLAGAGKLTASEVEAAAEIAAAVEDAEAGGVAAAGFEPRTMAGGGFVLAAPGRSRDLAERLRVWTGAARQRDLPVPALLNVIAHGKGLREAERIHRLRNGTLGEQLVEALRLYCMLWSIGDRNAAA